MVTIIVATLGVAAPIILNVKDFFHKGRIILPHTPIMAVVGGGIIGGMSAGVVASAVTVVIVALI